MSTLKNPQKQIPGGGFDFRQSEINWHARKVLGLHPSIDTVTRALISARKANPHHAAKAKWATDFNTVRTEVIAYNTKKCLALGWTSFVTEDAGGVPFPQAQSLLNPSQLNAAVGTIRKLWAGIKSTNEWLDSNAPAVASELSEKRASTCVVCPKNGAGDFTKWFTVPAAASIKRQIEKVQERKLTTIHDEKINICEACLCPLKGVVHIPIEIKLNNMTPEIKADLHESCWILSEGKELQPA